MGVAPEAVVISVPAGKQVGVGAASGVGSGVETGKVDVGVGVGVRVDVGLVVGVGAEGLKKDAVMNLPEWSNVFEGSALLTVAGWRVKVLENAFSVPSVLQ
jgi:hypothetical protein